MSDFSISGTTDLGWAVKGIIYHTCYTCGTRFTCDAEYVYKRMYKSKQYWFCRYSCMRRFDVIIDRARELENEIQILNQQLRAYRLPEEKRRELEKRRTKIKEELKNVRPLPPNDDAGKK